MDLSSDIHVYQQPMGGCSSSITVHRPRAALSTVYGFPADLNIRLAILEKTGSIRIHRTVELGEKLFRPPLRQ